MSPLEGLNYSNIINIDQVELGSAWQHDEGAAGGECRNVHSSASSHTWAAAGRQATIGYLASPLECSLELTTMQVPQAAAGPGLVS